MVDPSIVSSAFRSPGLLMNLDSRDPWRAIGLTASSTDLDGFPLIPTLLVPNLMTLLNGTFCVQRYAKHFTYIPRLATLIHGPWMHCPEILRLMPITATSLVEVALAVRLIPCRWVERHPSPCFHMIIFVTLEACVRLIPTNICFQYKYTIYSSSPISYLINQINEIWRRVFVRDWLRHSDPSHYVIFHINWIIYSRRWKLNYIRYVSSLSRLTVMCTWPSHNLSLTKVVAHVSEPLQ